MRPGLNHVAFWVGSREQVVRLVESAAARGWYLLFQDKHPFAGGRGTYVAYLENDAGFEVELAIELSRSFTGVRHGRAPCSHQKRS